MVGGQKSKSGTEKVKSCCAWTKLDAGTNLVPKDRKYCWLLIATELEQESDWGLGPENQNLNKNWVHFFTFEALWLSNQVGRQDQLGGNIK